MDEVPLSFDIPPTRTVDVQGARLFAAKTAADYTPLRIIRCFFTRKKGSADNTPLRIIYRKIRTIGELRQLQSS
ncbi:hypothetical protein TNCV_3091601 [Trichonephila clavipes]|nr:hypothetical protein TNCV_3091601 [Trichonephila clavipes]